MSDRPTVTRTRTVRRYTVDPPIDVEGFGAWSSSGKPRRYTITRANAEVGSDGKVSVWYGGRMHSGREMTAPIMSNDPALHHVYQAVLYDMTLL